VPDDRLRYVKDGHTLAHAIVDTVREALIVLDRNLRVVAASRSFYQTFGADPQDTQGSYSMAGSALEMGQLWPGLAMGMVGYGHMEQSGRCGRLLY